MKNIPFTLDMKLDGDGLLSIIKLWFRLAGLAVMIVAITACAGSKPFVSKVKPVPLTAMKVKADSRVHNYTAKLAQQLFENFVYGDVSKQKLRFAVATFVPVDTLITPERDVGPMRLLGLQLEQGMMTELSSRGYIAQDYKVTNSLIIHEKSDRVFSRAVDELSTNHPDVNFYLSGTLTEAQRGIVVNARIIDVKNKDVLGAATTFVPNDVLWQEEQVTTRGGMIYRSSGN